MATPDPHHEHHRFCEIVRGSASFMAVLEVVRELDLPQWAVAGGAVRNLVWDALTSGDTQVRANDIDVVYFDGARLDQHTDRSAERMLARTLPGHRWDVKNQAAVHQWYEQRFGIPVAPHRSIADAVASWPETATAIAVRLEVDDRLSVIAPLGIEDLFRMVWRHNPSRATEQMYRDRLSRKQPQRRWPGLRVVPPAGPLRTRPEQRDGGPALP